MKILPGRENGPGVSYVERKKPTQNAPGEALAPLCRVVPRAANRNKHDCRWQSYRYYAVTATPMTEGVYATDLLQAIVR